MRHLCSSAALAFLIVSSGIAQADGTPEPTVKALQEQMTKLTAVVAEQQKVISQQDSRIYTLMHYLPLAFGVDTKMTLEDGHNFCAKRLFPIVLSVETVPTGSVVVCGFLAPEQQGATP